MPEPKKILIVEDEMYLRIPLAGQFKAEGFDVFEAKNGLEGLEHALAEHPDIIILDIMMPKMGGTEMLEKLWEDPWGKNALVLILTNSVERDFVKDILGKNMPEYMVKSDWDISDIVKKVKHKLGMGEEPKASQAVITSNPSHPLPTSPSKEVEGQ
ncbi:response regulator [bacterium]|nr:response regulator [bacterium]